MKEHFQWENTIINSCGCVLDWDSQQGVEVAVLLVKELSEEGG